MQCNYYKYGLIQVTVKRSKTQLYLLANEKTLINRASQEKLFKTLTLELLISACLLQVEKVVHQC